MPELPEFVAPMLAKLGPAFDSEAHLFEVKWDGMRAVAFVEPRGLRLPNRSRRDAAPQFPELADLGSLEPGLVLDGEVVVTRDGKPDFSTTMSRAHARSPARIRSLARSEPASYLVFDLLYRHYQPLLERPLAERRAQLAEVVAAAGLPCLVLSEGVVGQGLALFEHTCKLELEGIVAKRLDSPYRPGRRSDAWIKIKRRQLAHCVILGYEPAGDDDFKSLIVAMEDGGELRCVGQVGSGIDQALRQRLNGLLRERPRPAPVIPCPLPGRWVEPDLFCSVSYLERTSNGSLRAPVFEGLITR